MSAMVEYFKDIHNLFSLYNPSLICTLMEAKSMKTRPSYSFHWSGISWKYDVKYISRSNFSHHDRSFVCVLH